MADRSRPRLVRIDNLDDAVSEISGIGCDPAGVKIMAPKALLLVIRVDRVNIPMAQILKKEMLSAGAEMARAKGAVNFSIDSTDVLMMGTVKQYQRVLKKLAVQPFGLKALGLELADLIKDYSHGPSARTITCGKHELKLGHRTHVMGVLNLTPDSFSDDGLADTASRDLDAIVKIAGTQGDAGADMLDIGVESSRPGSDPVDSEEERRRVLPVIEAVASSVDVPISIDTYKADVARAAIDSGATMINDISGLNSDPDMATVASESGVPLVLMHMLKTPKTMQDGIQYRDLMGDIIDGLRRSIELAEQVGVASEQLIVDPGIGFGKTIEHNLEIVRRLGELRSLGRAVLVGTSRKSFIGKILDLPPESRVEGTAATVALSIAGGADIVRVHDVEQMSRVAKLADAVTRRN